jgi:hypothetical protein
MGVYELNAKLKENDFRRILAEVLIVSLKIKFLTHLREKGGLF